MGLSAATSHSSSASSPNHGANECNRVDLDPRGAPSVPLGIQVFVVSVHAVALPATRGQDLEDEVGSGSFILLHWGREAVPLSGDAGGIIGVSSDSRRNITAWKHLKFVPLSFRHLPDNSRAVLFLLFLVLCPTRR